MNETKMEIEQMSVMPLIPLRGMTILPDTVIHFDLNREKSIKALEYAMVKGGKLFLVTQRNVEVDIPKEEELYRMGTIAEIKQITKLPNQIIRVLVEGIKRGILKRINEENTKFLEAYVEDVQSVEEEGRNAAAVGEAMIRQLREYFAQYAAHYPKIDKNAMHRYANVDDAGSLMDQIAMNLPISYGKKQQVLEAVSLKCRYDILCVQLLNEIEVAKVREELAGRMKERVDKSQKEYLLREQLRYIREELGEDKSFSDADQFEASLNELQASEEVKARIKKEISRFKSLIGSTSESAVERAYIETLLELPWDRASNDTENIKKAKDILEREHYGLEQVKERILEFLAVRCLTKKGESPIICLVGPPGTGKTSIAKSVAEALNKKYVRICLGGVRDEAEIRGHRKTYVGAMPGRIASGLKQAGVNNPLMLLDEIDKVSSDYRGDTSSALLEVLDSEQNHSFRDHYVEIPIDLSEVMFLATANSVQEIPRPLLDRMELIEVTSYTENEKLHIAMEHLTRKQMKKNGLKKGQLSIREDALAKVIRGYTKEAGVRGLERKIGEICRKAAREIYEDNGKKVTVTKKNVSRFLGKEKYTFDMANAADEVGIARGLAWTSVGGDTLEIEVNVMPGKGEFRLTGQLGDVMKESAQAGISYIRSVSKEFKIAKDFFRENDIHIHIPEGAVPKDGPSAGITMAAAMLSAVTKRKIRADVAMTGEITLRGRVLPIGGLKEKTLAAKNAGIKTICVPKKNEKDMDEISEEIKQGLEIVYVETMEDVLKTAFV